MFGFLVLWRFYPANGTEPIEPIPGSLAVQYLKFEQLFALDVVIEISLHAGYQPSPFGNKFFTLGIQPILHPCPSSGLEKFPYAEFQQRGDPALAQHVNRVVARTRYGVVREQCLDVAGGVFVRFLAETVRLSDQGLQ